MVPRCCSSLSPRFTTWTMRSLHRLQRCQTVYNIICITSVWYICSGKLKFKFVSATPSFVSLSVVMFFFFSIRWKDGMPKVKTSSAGATISFLIVSVLVRLRGEVATKCWSFWDHLIQNKYCNANIILYNNMIHGVATMWQPHKETWLFWSQFWVTHVPPQSIGCPRRVVGSWYSKAMTVVAAFLCIRPDLPVSAPKKDINKTKCGWSNHMALSGNKLYTIFVDGVLFVWFVCLFVSILCFSFQSHSIVKVHHLKQAPAHSDPMSLP